MRIVFAGTPEVAVPSLEALAAAGHEIVAVITRQDAPLGRKRVLTPTPVAVAAEALALETVKANRLEEGTTRRIDALQPDLGVIVAYGGLVREPLLSTPRLGWINLHFSLLPRWRGAAPVQRAIMAGDSVTGAAVFQLVPELDAGPVFAEATYDLAGDETAGEVLAALANSGADLLTSTIASLADATAVARPQVGTVTLAPKITLADAHIDFAGSSPDAFNRIRAVTPEPGAFADLDDSRFKIVRARLTDLPSSLPAGRVSSAGGRIVVSTGTRAIELLEVQPAGRRPMAAADWWRGRANSIETVLR